MNVLHDIINVIALALFIATGAWAVTWLVDSATRRRGKDVRDDVRWPEDVQ